MMSNDDAQKLFVAGLPDSVTDVVLRDLFTGAGTQVVDLSIPRDRMTGRPRGFAFVTLSSPDDVERALSMLDGHVLGDASISVRRFKAEPPQRGGRPQGERRGPPVDTSDRTLYVGNLPYDATPEEVETLLRAQGVDSVQRVHLPLDPDGRRRGFGFVTVGSADAARAAVDQLKGALLRGRPLVVNVALPKAAGGAPRGDRPFGGGPGGGGGGGFGGGGPGVGAGGPPANRFGPPAKPGGAKTDYSKKRKGEGEGGPGRGRTDRRANNNRWDVDDE